MSTVAIPKSAPFPDEEIELLNRVVGAASPVQRAWLAGFLAGVEASSGAPQTAAPPVAAEPLTIVYASESGNSELSRATSPRPRARTGSSPPSSIWPSSTWRMLPKTKRLVVIAATWGEGEPPARATRVYAELMGENAPRLDGVEFAVLALGDTAYVEFCAIGKALDERFAALGGKRVVDRIDCDLDFAAPAADWIGRAVKALAPADAGRGTVIEVDFGKTGAAPKNRDRRSRDRRAHQSEFVAVRQGDLPSGAPFDGAAPAYEPGDSLDVYAENDPAEVDELLKVTGLAADQALRTDFIKSQDIHTLSLKSLETYAALTGHQYVKALIADGGAREWIAGRQLIDLVTYFPIAITAEQLRAVTRPLAPRAYSIASSRREFGDEAHLLVSAVRYDSHGRAAQGRRLELYRPSAGSAATACG